PAITEEPRADPRATREDDNSRDTKTTSPPSAARCGLEGSSSLAGFDHLVRHHNVRGPIDFPFSESRSVRPGALEFYKASITSSDLVIGETTSNRRLTMSQRRRARTTAAAR